MRILHTSDWHLGKKFANFSLEKDFIEIIQQIKNVISENRIDTIIVAGDIFDRTNPPKEALQILNDFLYFVDKSDKNLILIAGNHDSGEYFESLGVASKNRFLIRGKVSYHEKPIILEDKFGKIAFFGLPYADLYETRECFKDNKIQNYKDILEVQLNSAKKYISNHMRSVVVAHSFVGKDVLESKSERSINVGGINYVPSSIFYDHDYVALGHIHKSQSVDHKKIRYSGSPLAFGFDENEKKYMTIIEINKKDEMTIEEIEFKPLRKVRQIIGNLNDLLQKSKSTDFIRAILTDENYQIDVMNKLREVYPNTVEIKYKKDEQNLESESILRKINDELEPLEMCLNFIKFCTNIGGSQEEKKIIQEKINHIKKEM